MDWISDYAELCRTEGLTILDGQSIKLFLVFRHSTPKVAKRYNKKVSSRKLESCTAFYLLSSTVFLCSTWKILLRAIQLLRICYLYGPKRIHQFWSLLFLRAKRSRCFVLTVITLTTGIWSLPFFEKCTPKRPLFLPFFHNRVKVSVHGTDLCDLRANIQIFWWTCYPE